jgi:hypothetical protein
VRAARAEPIQAVELRLDYTFNQGNYDVLAPSPLSVYTHDLQFGLSRRLGVSRRSSLGFSLGPSVIDAPTGVSYRVAAGGFVDLGIGRTWDLRAAYRRGVRFVQGFARAFYLDTVYVTAYGFAGSRRNCTGGLVLHGRPGFGCRLSADSASAPSVCR